MCGTAQPTRWLAIQRSLPVLVIDQAGGGGLDTKI